jgi:hypothetical protein
MFRLLLALLILASPASAGMFGQSRDSNYNINITAAGSGCTAATNYLARATGEVTHAADLTTMICGLVTDGVITGNLSGARGCGSHLDALYILAQQTQADSLLNLCGTSYTAVPTSGIPQFTTYRGWNGFNSGTGNVLDTNFNATTATSPNYIQNSTSFGTWSNAVVNEAAATMGTDESGLAGRSNLYPNSGGSTVSRNNYSSGATATVTTPGTLGLFTSERTTSTNTTLYWNGASQGNFTDVSAAPVNADFTVGDANGSVGTGSSQTLSASFIGGQLGATLQLALYTRLRTYMTAVGVP